MFEVAKGDLVRIDLVNDSRSVHPMHLHGHHFLVLSARTARRSQPWSTDTLEMLPHERYSVAFRANNPGLWMLHCHNLDHAADGLTMHVMYAGVTTPFRAGEVGAQRSRVATRRAGGAAAAVPSIRSTFHSR